MKRFKLIFNVLIVFVIAIMAVGCSKIDKSAENILMDLENAGFKSYPRDPFNAIAEITGNNEYDTECNIINLAELEETAVYTCKIVFSNPDLELTCDVEAKYKKGEDWYFSEYQIIDSTRELKIQIPKERVVSDIAQYFDKYGMNMEIDESTIEQIEQENTLGCNVTAKGQVLDKLLTKQYSIEVRYSFLHECSAYVYYSLDSYNWDVNALAGKKWLDTYKWSEGDFVYIESVDEANSTMMVGYRKGIYSSTIDGPLEEHGKPIKCTYTTDEECIKIKTDSFTFNVYPDMNIIMSGYKTYPSN